MTERLPRWAAGTAAALQDIERGVPPASPPAEDLEWRGLDGSVQSPGFIWRRAKKPDRRYGKTVRTVQTEDHTVYDWAIGTGRIASAPYYLHNDPRPYYQVCLNGERSGSHWRIDQLIELEPE